MNTSTDNAFFSASIRIVKTYVDIYVDISDTPAQFGTHWVPNWKCQIKGPYIVQITLIKTGPKLNVKKQATTSQATTLQATTSYDYKTHESYSHLKPKSNSNLALNLFLSLFS